MILSKKLKRIHIFHNEWLVKYAWLKQIPDSNSRELCKVCNELFAYLMEEKMILKSMLLEHSTNNSIIM
jgi:hypothetical protein